MNTVILKIGICATEQPSCSFYVNGFCNGKVECSHKTVKELEVEVSNDTR